jgi:hypothetical protein
MSMELLDYAGDGDLASIDRITSTAEGRGRINTEKNEVSRTFSSSL